MKNLLRDSINQIIWEKKGVCAQRALFAAGCSHAPECRAVITSSDRALGEF
jgi:hypothetical protein